MIGHSRVFSILAVTINQLTVPLNTRACFHFTASLWDDCEMKASLVRQTLGSVTLTPTTP